MSDRREMFMKKGPGAAEMPFLDHLEELRWRIIWSLAALLVGAFVGFWLVTRFNVLSLLIRPIQPFLHGSKLKYLSPTDPFFLTVKLALTIGFILALPIIVYQVWGFFAPALHPHEKRAIIPALYLGVLLFAGGVSLAYFAALPITLKFMMGFQVETLEQNIVVGPYLEFVIKLLLAFGAIFELPVVILVLATLGLVTSAFLKRSRRFAIAIAAVTAAVLTPGDAITLTIFMMLPLIVLYEMSILLARLVERAREKRAAAEPIAEAM
jgi:sec-independent protein translocase protein TatC